MKPSELLAKPEAWTQRAFARNYRGMRIPCGSKGAVRFCVSEAINRCFGDSHEKADNAFAQLASVLPIGSGVLEWNDAPERTHAEVIAKLQEAGL